MAHRCEVCDEVFNKSTHSPVKCPFCEFKSCTTCNERYLLETTQDAHCMACRKGWTRETLTNNFTSKFVTKTYKDRREDLLLEREKSMMPATQPYVELELRVRRLNDEIVKKTVEMGTALELFNKTRNLMLGPLAVEHGLNSEFEASLVRYKLATEKRKIFLALECDIEYLKTIQSRLMERIHGSNGIEAEKRTFMRACPYENCKGFLSTAWKCGLCENWTCPTCHEVKGKEKDGPHTCDPNNVATAELLARDSRNCPKCAAMIFKINGCDQMWCTQCHTAFSWRTGRVETHTVHNPHYYEYMRAHGGLARQPGDVPCGGMPDTYLVASMLRNIPRTDPKYIAIMNSHRSYGHAQWALVPRYNTLDARNENRDLRIKYMIGDIDDETFKKKIQQREKANARKTDIRQVVDMYMTILLDLFQSFVQNKNIDEMVENLQGLSQHYNSTLEKVGKVYKCAIPSLGPNFDFRV